MLKITFVTNRIALTGGFYYLFIITNRLYEKGYEVKIVAPGGKPWFFPQNKVEIIYPDERKIRIFKLLGKLLSLKYKSVSNFSGLDYIRAVGWKYGFDVDITSEMSKIIPESDLVIVGELFPYIWVFESRKFKKIALFPQGYPSHRVFYEKSIRNLLLYMVRYDYYISLTKIEADMVKSINPYKHTKYFIVNAGVDLDLFKAGSENRENIIMVILRDEPIKNPDLAIRTLNIVSQREKIKVVFVINNVNLIKKYKLNFDYEIYYRIPYEKLAELYRKAKVFLYTSRLEGFSLPPLEAMASGTAVVSTDNIGIREYAINGYNCLLDKEHNEENLANYVLELLRNDKLRGKIVKNGLETAKKFSWENITEKWINMLNRIEEDLK